MKPYIVTHWLASLNYKECFLSTLQGGAPDCGRGAEEGGLECGEECGDFEGQAGAGRGE